MERNNKVRVMLVNAMVAAIYTVIIAVFPFLAFGPIQFRFAEMLNHLIVFDKKYAWGIIGGVFVSNVMFMSTSELGAMDLIFGLGHSIASIVIALIIFRYLKNETVKMVVLSLVFSIMIFLVAIELMIAFDLPFWVTYLQTFTGEIVVMFAGIPVMKLLDRAVHFKKVMEEA